MASEGRSAGPARRAWAGIASLPASLVVAIGVLVVLAAVLFWAAATYTIVAEGELVPWDVGPIYQVEVFGRLTFYADGETARTVDVVAGILLAATAGTALLAYALLLRRGDAGESRARACFLVAALGAAWLAFDEMGGIHETVGYNLPFLADIPGIHRPDDALYLAYTVPAIAFLAVFRDVLFASRRVGALILLGIALFGAAVALDVLGRFVEELAEPLAALALLAAFVLLALDRVERPA